MLHIFDKISFVLSGLGSEKDVYAKKIRENGGTVLEIIPSDDDNQPISLILISKPSGFRRPNYLYALAKNIQIVHPSWICRCCLSKSHYPIDDYIIAKGNDCYKLYPTYRCVPKSSAVYECLLESINILNMAGPIWNDTLSCCGANLVPMNSSVRDTQLLILILIDPLKIDVEDLNRVKQAWNDSCRVVTIDWIVDCLLLDSVVDFDSCDIYSMPALLHQPHVYKSSNEAGERFIKYDVVSYRNSCSSISSSSSSSSDSNNIDDEYFGLIASFSCEDNEFYCNLTKLSVHNNDIGKDSDGSSITVKELHKNPENTHDIRIKAEDILSKLVVYSLDTYIRYSSYTMVDSSIYAVDKLTM